MEKHKYNKFGKKYLMQNIPLFLLLSILFFIIFTRAIVERFDGFFWASLSIFIIGIGFGIILDKIRLKKFHCPICNKHISKPTIEFRKEGDPINYYCERCNIG